MMRVCTNNDKIIVITLHVGKIHCGRPFIYNTFIHNKVQLTKTTM